MAANTTIQTAQGVVGGRILNTTTNSKKLYIAFQGIPYAQPPVGNLRFKSPQPALPWDGVLEAKKEGPSCPQKHVLFQEYVGNEDNCLVLNVYTPQVASSSGGSLPVMVWFHGGGFTFGSGATDFQGPDYWMEKDVVLVTCNYRLGALGFLSLGSEEVPGNAGLKDQVMVLRWVKCNIMNFGGDPQNVTIFGESAGSASVHYHLFSPMSRGLFHRAILMSGSSFNNWAISHNPIGRSLALGERLGCKTSNTVELLRYLQSVPAFDIVKLQNKVLSSQDKQDTLLFPFVPCIEPIEGKGEKFLTDDPRKLLQKGLVAPVPLIIGSTSKEGMLFLNDTKVSDKYFRTLNSNFSRIIPKNMGFPEKAPEQIKNFFFKNKELNWDTVNEYLDLYGDLFFYIGLDETIRLHLTCGPAPIYCYRLNFDGELGYLSAFIRQMYPDIKLAGVCHSDDIGYIFTLNIPGFPQLKPNSPESEVVSYITTMFSHFAKTGNPNAPGKQINWKPAEKDGSNWRGYIDLDHQVVIKYTRIDKERAEFWDSLRKHQSKL